MTPEWMMSQAGEPPWGSEGLGATVHSDVPSATKLYLSELFFHFRRHIRVCFCFKRVCDVLFIYQLGAAGVARDRRGGRGEPLPCALRARSSPADAAARCRQWASPVRFRSSLRRLVSNWKLSRQWDPRALAGTAFPDFNVNLMNEERF